MSKVDLVWATPKGDELIAYMARVSNPNAKQGDPSERLINYLIKHQHWSPFEMVNLCVSIECPRDISRQILRHRSFHFQEFSGRYASYDAIDGGLLQERETRMADLANRQNSIPITDLGVQGEKTKRDFDGMLHAVRSVCWDAYRSALDMGIAKEVARVLLPEGLVPTKMYMNGTVRSWIHYINIRTGPETQKEHRDVAEAIKAIFVEHYPETAKAVGW